ncbi:uncharacterized protein FOKN1_1314 [Thiohalobacter thiocyanaticus]|uniref:Uncharacterized protein n=1 Tax=Thiohalobacter thiocyanaticus TaxID=585455 RepID=A0A1Z4VQM2_9GAMM|nr:hypothetical protein [Thiohalobacter thiocyanaticus]BAZ93712.1 uncharacterized protein FOKN1_1314 [Thiohalobacter thiocyanaticus]
MRFLEYNKCRVIISIVLMMMLAQLFSPHFHIAADIHDGQDHSHAHSHALDSGQPGHQGADHDEASSTDTATQVKQSGLFAGLVLILVALFLQRLPRLRHRPLLRGPAPHDPLLRFRPPLRAPPL